MVLAPLFKDMSNGLSDPLRALEAGFDVLADTARFVRDRLGGRVMGLGATLPLLRYLAAKHLGKTLSLPGLTITTGHGGTVWLLNEAIKLARATLPVIGAANIGMIGTGGIGRSTADYLLTEDPAAWCCTTAIQPSSGGWRTNWVPGTAPRGWQPPGSPATSSAAAASSSRR
jgi:hypothetical protein